MMTRKALHSRHNTDRRYVSRREGSRGLTSTEDSVDVSIQRLEDYIHKRGGRLITAIKNNTVNTINRKKKKKNWKINNSMGTSSDKQTESHTRLDMAKKGKP